MASVVTNMDDLVKDYLLFRGFSGTLKSLEAEIKTDKDRGLRAEKVMDLLNSYVNNYEITLLREFWSYLDSRYFSRLEQVYMSSVKKLEISLLRWYVINAVQNNRNEKVVEFFEKIGSDHAAPSEWRDWFSLPFTKNVEEAAPFQMYFTKQWQDTFLLSLHNFLSVIFQNMPLPSLLMFDDDLRRMKQLQKECDHYKKQLTMNSVDSVDYIHDPTQHSDNKPKQVVQYNHLELVDDFYDKSTNEANATVIDEESKNKGVRKFLGKIGNPSSPTPKVKNTIASAPAVAKKYGKEHAKSLSVNKTPTRQKKLSADSFKPRAEEKNPRENEPRDLGVPESDSSRSKSYILLSQDDYSEHHSAITHCRFSESGKHVASSDMDGVVKIWGLNPTPTTVSTIMSRASIMCFEWPCKTDRLILLGNKACQLKLYDIKEKRNLIDITLDQTFPRITSLLSNPNGSNFICAASCKGGGYLSEKAPRTGNLTCWNLKSMEKERDILSGSSAITAMTFNHNGQLLLLGTTDGVIKLYDVRNYNCTSSWLAHTGDIYTLQFGHDEQTCFSLGLDGRFVEWSIYDNGAVVKDYNLHQGIAGPFSMTSLTGQKTVVTPRGRLFACDYERKCVLTCNGNAGAIYSLADSSSPMRPHITVSGHKSPVITVDWSSHQDSRNCLTGSMDGKIILSTLLK